MSVMNTWRRKSIHFLFRPRDMTDSRTFCALRFSLPLPLPLVVRFLVLVLVEVDAEAAAVQWTTLWRVLH